MRLLLIGLLIVLVVHALLRLAAKVPPSQLGSGGRILARLGFMLGIFMPRTRTLSLYLLTMFPFLRAFLAGANGQPNPASVTGMAVAEARELLGVNASASRDEINAAWRRLLLQHHPDHGGTAEATQRLNEARDLLLKQLD